MKDTDSKDVVKRLKYNNGQLLDEYDFQAEQDYHREMRMRHNRSVHSWGIVEGLNVSTDGTKVKVSAGMAIDKDGQELVLLKEEEPKLPTGLQSTARYLTAKFDPQDDEKVKQLDEDGKKDYSCRIVEHPKFETPDTEPAKDGAVIVLARLDWNGEGKITVDSAARSRSVSSRIDPAADLTVRSLSLGGDAAAPEEPLQIGKGGIDKNCFITLYSGGGKYGGIKLRSWDWGYGFTIQHQNAPMGLNILRHQKSGNGASALLITRDTGNIGIGTTDPKSTLSVKGGLAVGTTYAGTNPAPDNALLVEGKVGIGTDKPANNLTVTATVQATETDITQNVANNGLNIEAKWVKDNYLPGIIWTTSDNNATKPKAGIWISEHDSGSRLYLGTSNAYATGITNKAITIHESGSVGIGMTGPGANLDVSGASNKAGQISLQLRSGNTADNYESNQVTLGYANTAQYRHAIKTRHHGGQAAGNAIDFYVWQYGTESGAADRIGGLHTMTLNGGNVGIGATGPEAKLDVNGDVIVAGAIKGRYKDTPELDKNRSDSTKKVLEVVAKQKAAIIQGYGRGATATPEKYPPHLFALLYDYDSHSTPGILDINTGFFKTFIIDHPLDDDKYLLHATLEGPEGAVYYRGTARLNNGRAQIQLPPYFEALTRAEGRTVLLTNVDGFDPLAVLTQDGAQIRDGRFIVVSSNKESNQVFDWEVKAIRQDVQALEVEPSKSAIKVERFGPYAYAVPANGDRTRTQPPPANPNSTEPQTGAGGPRSKIATIR